MKKTNSADKLHEKPHILHKGKKMVLPNFTKYDKMFPVIL